MSEGEASSADDEFMRTDVEDDDGYGEDVVMRYDAVEEEMHEEVDSDIGSDEEAFQDWLRGGRGQAEEAAHDVPRDDEGFIIMPPDPWDIVPQLREVSQEDPYLNRARYYQADSFFGRVAPMITGENMRIQDLTVNDRFTFRNPHVVVHYLESLSAGNYRSAAHLLQIRCAGRRWLRHFFARRAARVWLHYIDALDPDVKSFILDFF